MSQSLDECKKRLASIQSYRRQFVAITKATVTSSKTLDFGFHGPFGFEGQTVIATVETDSPQEFAFESWGGNIEVMGLAEFTAISSGCTEVSLAINYEIANPFFAWLDRKLHFVDKLLTAELRSLRAHFEGVATPLPETAPAMGWLEPVGA